MGTLITLAVLWTSLWMYLESHKFGYDKADIKGLAAMGPRGWFFAGLLLWIVAFPLYLASREKLKAAGEARRQKLASAGLEPKRPSKLGPAFAIVALSLITLAVIGSHAPKTPATPAFAAAPIVAAEPAKKAPAEPGFPTIPDGTYEVGTDIQPGIYRVGDYWARLNKSQGIIANDANLGSNCPTLVVVQPTDAYLEIRGEAVSASLFTVDPIAKGCTSGTFLVGKDIAPGRYRIKADGEMGYWARLNSKLGVIANDINNGQLIVVVRPNDFALQIRGVESMERMADR